MKVVLYRSAKGWGLLNVVVVIIVAGIGDLDDFGSLSTVPMTVKVSSSKKTADKPRITVMYDLCIFSLN